MAIDQFTRSLPMMLYRALDTVMPSFRKIFNDFGLTEQQWRVLRVLWEGDDITIRQLAEVTLIPAPSLVGIVDRLERDGLVARQRLTTDRRKVNVAVTQAGAELEDKIMPRVASAYVELKQSVDAETWSQVLVGLQRIAVQRGVERGE
jgi:homoprotocatechuate degradation regulator HpaR